MRALQWHLPIDLLDAGNVYFARLKLFLRCKAMIFRGRSRRWGWTRGKRHFDQMFLNRIRVLNRCNKSVKPAERRRGKAMEKEEYMKTMKKKKLQREIIVTLVKLSSLHYGRSTCRVSPPQHHVSIQDAKRNGPSAPITVDILMAKSGDISLLYHERCVG